MKGIVVEINEKDAVILSDEGLFTKIKNKNYQIGQTIKIEENKKFASKWIAGAASMAAALALCTTGAYAYYTPTDYVSLDVNPSVEYSVNRFDRILDVKAVNDDGKAILSELDLKNMTIQNGMKETLDQLIADGYLKDDPDSGVVITTSNDNMKEAEQLATELKQEVKTYLDTQDGIAAEVDSEAVGPDRVEEARGLGVTPGKLNLVEKLQESTKGAISKEEWLAMPVREINKAIKENRRLEKEKDRDKGLGNTENLLDGTGRTDRGNIVSEGGIKGKKEDAPQPEKSQPKGQNGKHNSKQEDEQVSNDAGQGGSGIINETDQTDNADRLKNEKLKDNGNGHNDKNKPDNGKSPKGDNN